MILPETKGVSLERMDKLFGEIDYVEAQEAETTHETRTEQPWNSTQKEPKQHVEVKGVEEERKGDQSVK